MNLEAVQQNVSISALHDYPFKAQLTCAGSSLNDYDQATCEIWKSMNYNADGILEKYRLETVHKIISAYYDLQIQNSDVPELNYDYSSIDGQKKLITVIIAVTQRSGFFQADVELALRQLYYGTKDGRIRSRRILSPRSYHTVQGDPREETTEQSIKNVWDSATGATKTVITVVGIIAVSAGLYYASKIVSTFKAAK